MIAALPEYLNKVTVFYAALILYIVFALIVEYRRWRR
jgi:hypothetical protein